MRLEDIRFLVAYDRWATRRVLRALLAHVINHGTQHRSEAAALLTAEGRSPGDLDMVFFAEELAATRGAQG